MCDSVVDNGSVYMYVERCYYIENEGDLEFVEKIVEFFVIIKIEYGFSVVGVKFVCDMKEVKEYLRS